MSADNWAMCPRCLLRHEAEVLTKKTTAEAAYGKVSLQEWQDLQEAAIAARKPIAERNFREDYDIGMDTNGELDISYSGNCSKCGWSVSYGHSFKPEGLTS
jgi:hypothetical protein